MAETTQTSVASDSVTFTNNTTIGVDRTFAFTPTLTGTYRLLVSIVVTNTASGAAVANGNTDNGNFGSAALVYLVGRSTKSFTPGLIAVGTTLNIPTRSPSLALYPLRNPVITVAQTFPFAVGSGASASATCLVSYRNTNGAGDVEFFTRTIAATISANKTDAGLVIDNTLPAAQTDVGLHFSFNNSALSTALGGAGIPWSFIRGILPLVPYAFSDATTPSALSGLFTWLKADALALANGAEITAWPDSTGLGHNAFKPLGTAGVVGPTFVTNVFNGRPAARFIAANKNALHLPAGSVFAGPRTVFLVNLRHSDLPNQVAIMVDRGGAVQGNWELQANIAQLIGWNDAIVPVAINGPTGYAPHILTVLFETDGTTLRRNFTAAAKDLNTFVSNGGSNIGLGCRALGGVQSDTFSNIDFAELIIFNRALTATEILGVEHYLANKYGLPNWQTVTTTGGTSPETFIGSTEIKIEDLFQVDPRLTITHLNQKAPQVSDFATPPTSKDRLSRAQGDFHKLSGRITNALGEGLQGLSGTVSLWDLEEATGSEASPTKIGSGTTKTEGGEAGWIATSDDKLVTSWDNPLPSGTWIQKCVITAPSDLVGLEISDRRNLTLLAINPNIVIYAWLGHADAGKADEHVRPGDAVELAFTLADRETRKRVAPDAGSVKASLARWNVLLRRWDYLNNSNAWVAWGAGVVLVTSTLSDEGDGITFTKTFTDTTQWGTTDIMGIAVEATISGTPYNFIVQRELTGWHHPHGKPLLQWAGVPP